MGFRVEGLLGLGLGVQGFRAFSFLGVFRTLGLPVVLGSVLGCWGFGGFGGFGGICWQHLERSGQSLTTPPRLKPHRVNMVLRGGFGYRPNARQHSYLSTRRIDESVAHELRLTNSTNTGVGLGGPTLKKKNL